MKSHRTVRKYVISSAIVASVVFTPLATGSAFAHVNQDAVQKSAQQYHHQSILQQGNIGQAVKTLQSKLKNAGYNTNVDGIFGPKTEEAVRNAQGDNGITVDGIAGPKTNNAMAEGKVKDANVNNTSGEAKSETVSKGNNGNESTDGTHEETDESNANANGVVSLAEDLKGTRYLPGGKSPAGFDSSGFVKYVLEHNGVNLNGIRTEHDLWASSTGTRVNASSPTDAKPGDVIYFEKTYENGEGGATHSGIYIGGNKMIHSNGDGGGVVTTNLNYDVWQNKFLGVKSY